MSQDEIVLETAHDVLRFHRQTACLLSFRRRAAPGQEFIAWAPDHPAFVIGYLDNERQYHLLSSQTAQGVQVQTETDSDGYGQILTATYQRLLGQDIDVAFHVRARPDEAMSRWGITVRNEAGLEIVDVQFPFVVCADDLGGEPGGEALLLPHGYGSGKLVRDPFGIRRAGGTGKMGPDIWQAWEFSQHNGNGNHYPGLQFAQFLAYYNERAGLYLACEDPAANIKRFMALRRTPGIRLGVAHVGDWPRQGVRRLEYDTVLASFSGDWYDAAEMYRAWTLTQDWAVPLLRRQDVPGWLLDSPVYIAIRPQGMIDEGPVFPVKEFLPYERCLPLLEHIATRVEAPLVVVLLAWEGAGPWVYPETMPPVGGEQSLVEFARHARARGWHLGAFGNGTRWVLRQHRRGYDGRPYYRQHNGERSVCRRPDNSPWHEDWDSAWRLSLPTCLGAEQTRQIAVDWMHRLMQWGMQSLQFLDQNNGAATFLCFGADHEHPPVPGKWMLAKMRQTMAEFQQAQQETETSDVIHSVESGVNECCLPLFQQTDIRPFPPGDREESVPLYQFLFHECIIIQGMLAHAPEPYHLPIASAANCVLGALLGGVLTGDGTLLSRDAGSGASWEPRTGNHDNALQMMRSATALRRGPGRDFLVYGRMLRPAQVEDIKVVAWQFEGREHRIPAVLQTAWQAPDGRLALALANWTTEEQRVAVTDSRLGKRVQVHVSAMHLVSQFHATQGGALNIALPPLACALVEARAGGRLSENRHHDV